MDFSQINWLNLTLLFALISVSTILFRVVKSKSDSKGTSTNDGLDLVSKFLNASESLYNFIDKNPNDNDEIEIIIKACKEAVLCAEELERVGVMSKEEKKEKVTEFLYIILKNSGVSITPKVEKLVDLFIESAVILKN